MKTIQILIFSFILMTACKDKQATLNYVDTIIENGCSGTFTYDSISLDQKQFIFTTDVMEHANIKIGEKEILLKKDSTITPTENEQIDIYSGEGYTINLIINKVNQIGDEVYTKSGTLLITKDKIIKYKIKIHGESGC
ncbi:MAG TPA: hypothetical protein VF868_00095 [Bacteroidia bacterium]|jgi:hypothetical protein